MLKCALALSAVAMVWVVSGPVEGQTLDWVEHSSVRPGPFAAELNSRAGSGTSLTEELPIQVGSVRFSESVISTTAHRAQSVFATDVDGDGDIDVLSASAADDKIAWYESDGRSPPSFTERVISIVADGAVSVFATDMDGDGDTDVLSASCNDNKIAWYESDGGLPPTFTERVISIASSAVNSVFAIDVDGDGNTDVLSASWIEIVWYQSDGGSPPAFTERVISTTVFIFHSVFAADVDGDGDIDVLSASIWDDKIAWYESDGGSPPSFTQRVISATADGAASVFAADIDGDGNIDVVSASNFDNKIAWYRSNGGSPPSFSEQVISTTALEARSVFATDLDGDGDTDVLSASWGGDKIAWYENDPGAPGLPIFTEHVISTTAERAWSVFATDVDGDGDVDVLSASELDNKIAWYENTPPCGNGSIDPGEECDDGGESAPCDTDCTLAECGDGTPNTTAGEECDDGFTDDCGSCNADCTAPGTGSTCGDGDLCPEFETCDDSNTAGGDGCSSTCAIEADVPFSERVISTSADGANSIFATDVDGDGDIDVLSASFHDDKIAWYESDGGSPPTFTERFISTTVDGAQSVFATDVDGDGDIDVLSASWLDDKIAWFESDGGSPPAFTERIISTAADGANSVIAADLDGDGDTDVLSASWLDDKIAWYESDGGSPPAFIERVISTAADKASSIFAADVDGDGDADVLSASFNDNKIAWYESNGGSPPTFTERVISTAAHGAASVFATDVDGDGDIDVLSASLWDAKIAWYESDGGSPPTFTERVISTNSDGAISVFAMDVDGDGDTDVLSKSSSEGKIAWYESDGGSPPTFTERVISTTANLITSVFAMDLDGDGDTDVLFASSVDDKIAWYENLSSCGFDSNCDGDVDLEDFALFQKAFSDGDVDLEDFALFQEDFSGPQQNARKPPSFRRRS